MAKKRIGAIIALDGEKEFKNKVTDVNKSLTAMKSELSLVKAECEGQANTLASLSKKHEVLTKILEAQKDKVSKTQDGLNHARESYDRVSDGLEELRKQETLAIQKMDEMKNSSETTKEALKEQEKVVKELGYAIETGQNNLRKASVRISEWENKLNTAKSQAIKATREVEKNAAYMKEAEKATDNCATSIDNFGKLTKRATEVTESFGEKLKSAFVNKAVDNGIDKLKELGTSALDAARDSDAANKQIQASTGISAETAKKYKEVMNDLYGNNFGNDFSDVGEAISIIAQNLGEIDSGSMKETAENAITLRDTFGMDYQEQLRSVKMLMDTFGVSSTEAYNLIAQGAQNGLNKNGDLLDTINEYSVHYEQLGLSAEEFFNSLENGTASGTFSVDKLGDAMKEFGIRTKDTAESTSEGFELIGLDADEMRNKFAEGGESAKEATEEVLKALFSMDDKVKQNQAGVDLFGTMWEDLGKDGVRALMDVNGSADMTLDKMTDIKEIKYDDLNSKISEIGRTFQMNVMEKVEEHLPFIEEMLEVIGENIDTIVIGAGGLAGVLGTMKLVNFASETAGSFQSIMTGLKGTAEAAEDATETTGLLSKVLGGGSLKTAAVAVGALAVGYGVYKLATRDAYTETEKLVEKLQEEAKERKEVDDTVSNNIASRQEEKETMEKEWDSVETLADKLMELNGIEEKTTGQKEMMKSIVDELSGRIPELAEAFDAEKGSIDMTEESLEKLIETSREAALMEAANAKIAEIARDVIDAEMNLDEAVKKRAEVAKELEKAKERASGAGAIDSKAIREMQNLEREYKNISNEVDKYTKTLNDANEQMEAAEKAMDNYGDAMKKGSKETQNMYKKVKKSFEDMAKEAEKSGTSIPDGLEKSFNEAINKAEKLGIEIPDEIASGIMSGGQEAADAVNSLNELIRAEEEKSAETAKETYKNRARNYKSGLESQKEEVAKAAEDIVDATNKTGKTKAAEAKAVGTEIDRGVSSGILSGQSSVIETVRGFVANIINAAKKKAGIQSPSKVFKDEVGQMMTAGVAQGIKSGQKDAVSASIELCQVVLNSAEKETAKLSSKITNKISGNFGVSRYTKEDGKKVRKKADDYYGEILSAAEQYLSNMKVTNDISLEQEKLYWEKVIKQVKKGTQAWYDAKSNLKSVKEELKELEEERKAAEAELIQEKREYGLSGNALAAYKTYYNVSAKAEMEYWDIVRNQFEKGTAERLEADQKYLEAKESYNEQLLKLNEEYAENCNEVNAQMKDDIEELTKAYQDAVKSRKDEILSSTSIFEQFESTGYTKDRLLYNLKTQVAGIELWKEDLGKLEGKGFSEAVLEQIKAMGPEAAASIHSLTEMSEAEIEEYNKLWEKKEAMAEAQSLKENEVLRSQTEKQIKTIQEAADSQIAAYKQKYSDAVESLSGAMTAPLAALAQQALSMGEQTALNFVAGLNSQSATGISGNATQLYQGDLPGPILAAPLVNGNVELAELTSLSETQMMSGASIQYAAGYTSSIDTSGIDKLFQAIETTEQNVAKSNVSNTSANMDQLLAAIETLGDAILGIQIVLDSGALVGQLQPGISQESALQIIRKRRGGRL